MLAHRWLSRLKSSRSAHRTYRRPVNPLSPDGVRDWLLEDRCLLSADVPVGSDKPLNTIFWNGGAATSVTPPSSFIPNLPAPPDKFITISNNTDKTVYPFLRDANTGQFAKQYFYDPQDFHEQEYRAYVGYNDGTDRLGLRSGETITFKVPVVFWDGGNIYIATNPDEIIPAAGAANPLNYNPASDRGVAKGAPWVTNSTGGNGLIMFYHHTISSTPNNGAPAQLGEFTIRDPYLVQHFGIPASSKQGIVLINYDVSYVDSMILPVAMEAKDVPIPSSQSGHPDNYGTENFGWVGADKTLKEVHDALVAFTSKNSSSTSNENGLGQYFDGNGWPAYFNPNPDILKIPAGSNVFASSPLNNTRSPYNVFAGNDLVNQQWMLTSGGRAPIRAGANGTPDGNTIKLTFISDAQRKEFFDPLTAMLADKTQKVALSSDPNTPFATPVAFITEFTDNGNQNSTLTLDRTVTGPNASYYAYRQVEDYAVPRITNIWYSWAKFYLSTKFVESTRNGTAAVNTNVLKLDDVADLKLGMTVTSATGGLYANTVIIGVNKEKKEVYLNQNTSAPISGSFSFGKPVELPFSNDPSLKTFDYQFTTDKDNAELFAASVYTAMYAESLITIKETNLPGSMNLVGRTIGADLTHLPNSDPDKGLIGGQVRDLIKSILRGVHDFNVVSDESLWYPDPSVHTGNQQFNVYNLNPFVWFVHHQLKLSGYGFSVDDDAADVGANGSNELLITLGKVDKLTNQNEWFGSLPWGEKTDMAATITQGTDNLGNPVSILTLSDPKIYNQVKPDDLKNSLIGAYVIGDGIVAGTNLKAFGNLDKLQFILSHTALSSNGPIKVTFVGKKPVKTDAPLPLLTSGTGGGGSSQVTFNFSDGTSINFTPFPATFTGGTRVAEGDVSGDGFPDVVVGAGPGGGPQVNIYNSSMLHQTRSAEASLIVAFHAFPIFFSGGVRVAVGKLTDDRYSDLVVGAGPGGGPQINVYDGRALHGGVPELIVAFHAFPSNFTGGVTIALGDVNGDGRPDLIVGAGAGGMPQVNIYDGRALGEGRVVLISAFYAFPLDFRGGVNVGAGTVDEHGLAEIVVGAGAGALPQVSVFRADGLLLNAFYAYDLSFRGGVEVSIGTYPILGKTVRAIITGAGPGGGPQQNIFDAKTLELLSAFYVGDPSFRGGVVPTISEAH